MKDVTFDAHIVAANPHSDYTNTFVSQTMQHIKRGSLAAHLPQPQNRGFVFWLRHLHKPTLALLALVAITLVSGAVYAAVHFAPAFIQLLGKETNPRGATEYSSSGFKDCSSTDYVITERFEIKSDAPALSDKDVQKTLQAKCEMTWVNDFVNRTWPRTDGDLKEGDRLYYTRVDVMGRVERLSETAYTVRMGGANGTSEHQAASGEKIKAYLSGAEIPLGNVKNGDYVFTIVRASEVFHDYRNCFSNPKSENKNPCPTTNDMRVEGAVAVFKMSLPEKYYTEMQSYITEVPQCPGNEDEYCPNTPFIDVYPRTGGEGASNPYLQQIADPEFRQISGTVTELSDNTLTLTSRSGKTYTVTVGDSGFKVYNRDYADDHTDIDATLRVGSNVGVMYAQPKGADPTHITKEQVTRVNLQLEALNPKKGNIKQY